MSCCQWVKVVWTIIDRLIHTNTHTHVQTLKPFTTWCTVTARMQHTETYAGDHETLQGLVWDCRGVKGCILREERFYTPPPPPPGNDFWDCRCAIIQTKASIHHPLWVVVTYKIALPIFLRCPPMLKLSWCLAHLLGRRVDQAIEDHHVWLEARLQGLAWGALRR